MTANETMVRELKELWKICFGDSDKYIDNFFKNAFDPERTMVYVRNGSVCGAAYLFPCEICGKRASYLYAGGVFPRFRKQGIYEEMMSAWSQWCIEREIIPFLKPANDKLWKYYKKIGFVEFIGGERLVLCDGDGECDISRIGTEEFLEMRDNSYIHWLHTDYILSENRICGGDCIKITSPDGECAAVFVIIGDVIHIRGFAGKLEILKNCAKTVARKLSASKICINVCGDKERITATVGKKFTDCVTADLLMD